MALSSEKANAQRRGRLQYDLNRAATKMRRFVEHAQPPHCPRGLKGGISASGLLNDVPHRVCSPSLSPHAPVVVLVRLGVQFVHEGGEGIFFYLERRAGHYVHPPIITLECGSLNVRFDEGKNAGGDEMLHSCGLKTSAGASPLILIQGCGVFEIGATPPFGANASRVRNPHRGFGTRTL
eukprot:scaffold24806_cov129-Isochrysis_galbana.AAC.6